jgi:hypothetical protein
MTKTLLETLVAYYMATRAAFRSVRLVVERFRTQDAPIRSQSAAQGRWASRSDLVLVPEKVQHVGIHEQALRGIGALLPLVNLCERAVNGMDDRVTFLARLDNMNPPVLLCRTPQWVLHRAIFYESLEGYLVIERWQIVIESLKGAAVHKINAGGIVTFQLIDYRACEGLVGMHRLNIWVRRIGWHMAEGFIVFELKEPRLSGVRRHIAGYAVDFY